MRRYLSGRVQAQVVQDYQERLGNGRYRYTLNQIADKHEVSLSTVNNLVRKAKVQGRPKGGSRLSIPTHCTMKILRDSTEPGITLEQIGIRNPRVVMVNGRSTLVPRSKQRIKQILDHWKKAGNPGLRQRGFKPGDLIEWGGYRFRVLRYDDSRTGAVQRVQTGEVVDPFLWIQGSTRPKRVIEV